MKIDSQTAILEALGGFRLKGFDWDGSGGLPLRGDVDATIQNLFGVAEVLGETLLMSLPDPGVSMAANGTVEMSFDAWDGKELHLTVECEGVISYIKVYEDGQTSVDGVIRLDFLGYEFNPDDFVELTELFGWLNEE